MARLSVYCFFTALALLVLSLPPPSRGETINCTPITSLPATISAQGVYCLTGNLATAITTGDAINITANNVTLDLNGWKVGGQAAGLATGVIGIFSDAANVTVKNGIVRGFRIGIELDGRGAVVEDLLIDQNTFEGITVVGQGAIVRRNQVVDTGGSTAVPNVTVFGIVSQGPGSLIEENLVSGLQGTGFGGEVGIIIEGANSLARNNFVTDTAKPTGGGTSQGIAVLGGTSVNILSNTVTNMNTCISYASPGAGLYASNTVAGCDTNFLDGTAGQQGNNF
jgi:hypothetical protein